MQQHKAITFTSKQLKPAPGGGWHLRVTVDGKRIKQKLTDPRLTTKDEALRVAREIVRDARAGRWDEIDATKTRRGIATIGEILTAYTTTPDLDHVAPSGRKENALALRLVIREGLAQLGHRVKQPTRIAEGGKVKFIYHEDKLSSELVTHELGVAFKQWRLANTVPRTGTIDPRRECDEPVGGNLEGADLQRMKRSANSVLRKARSVFTKATLDPEHGPFQSLNLPDVSGFLKVRGFTTNKATQYVPPPEMLIEKIVAVMPNLKAGTLLNDSPEHKPRGLLKRKPGNPNWVAKWRKCDKLYRTRSTGTTDRAEAQSLADEWAAAEGYVHHDKRFRGAGFYIHNAPGYSRTRRGKRIDQRRVYVAMRLALDLGLRLGEIAEARWSQFSRIGNRRIFNATETETFEGTKGKADRLIPVSDELFDELRSMLEDSVFVIGGSPHYRKRVLPMEVAGVMRSCGWRRVECLHELRKVFASDYGREVKDPTIVKEVLGHKHLTTTMRYLALNRTPPKKTSRLTKVAA